LHSSWMQGPEGSFQDRTRTNGVLQAKWRTTGFGTVFADFDQDGALDLAMANGRVYGDSNVKNGQPSGFWTAYADRNQLFANDGTGRFRDISSENPAFSGTASVWRGLA